MARALVDFGFREVHCTPHCIAGHYEISPVEVRAATGRLQAELDLAGIALRLHPGMEYYLDDGFERFAANLLPLGESRLVLCEAPPQALPGVVAAMLELIVVQGFIPLIAHPERSETVWVMLEEQWQLPAEEPPAPQVDQSPSLWRRWFASRSPADPRSAAKDSAPGTLPSLPPELPDCCLYQANLGSFAGFYGARPQRRAYELLQRKIYHCFASDLHDVRSIPGCLEPAREKLQYNPALQRLGDFVAPQGAGGCPQMAFW
jgi:protein-tyrosine phosphatase